VNQNRSHVDELGRDVHVQLAQFFYVRQILAGDSPDGNIVDINILLANQVKQQVERPFVHIFDRDGEGEVAFLIPGLFLPTRRSTSHKHGTWIQRRSTIESQFYFFAHRAFVSTSYFITRRA